MAGHFQSVLAASDLSAYFWLLFPADGGNQSDHSSFRSLCDLRLFSQFTYFHCPVSVQ
jgi:hypothetical protein